MKSIMNENFDEIANSIIKADPLHLLLGKLADNNHYNNYSKNIIDLIKPLRFLCGCTCESLLARSHFICFILTNALSCTDRLVPYRLSSGHKFISFFQFKDSCLSNEPLYQVNDTFDNDNKQENLELMFLKTTNSIYYKYSKESRLHPYKIYWTLVRLLNIDEKVASVYHSSQGIVRLCIAYIFQYFKKNPFEYDTIKVLELYEEIANMENTSNTKVLPYGVDYDYYQGANFLKAFYIAYKKNYDELDEELKAFCFGRIVSFSIQILRLLSEYESNIVSSQRNDLLKFIDNALFEMYNYLSNKEIAEYYFEQRWRNKCNIYAKNLFSINYESEKNILFDLCV